MRPNMWPQDPRFAIPERPYGQPQYAPSTVPPAMDQLLQGQASQQASSNLARPAPTEGQRRKRASKPKVRTGCITCKVCASLPELHAHLGQSLTLYVVRSDARAPNSPTVVHFTPATTNNPTIDTEDQM